MASKILTKPRMVVEITHEQQIKLNKYLSYGERRRVFSAILADVLVMLDEFGHDFVAFILDREFTYRSHMVNYNENRRSTNTITDKVTSTRTTGADITSTS